MPGTAHGLASVTGSRRNGSNSSPLAPAAANANSALRSGSVATSGISHGSEPLARYPSESRTTGVR